MDCSSEGATRRQFASMSHIEWTACQRITPEEYQQQSREYTRAAIEALQQSPEYLAHIHRCSTCGQVWYHQRYSQGCPECGDAAMTKPCPLCSGRCGGVWERDTSMSNSFRLAHWNGECKLTPGQIAELQYLASDPSLEHLADAFTNAI
eukprot:TRINITY_DN5398_c0_g1_i2.p1 TRINITY_DN5398_c0_g1~~TRINITY_DN5398_c0_g1_i2.p1  ORF type:complete len:149 (+),score=20.37 TRINITY_DN5398_c0_g1_i2:51-497(+)